MYLYISPTSKPLSISIMFCTKCGNQLKDGYKFCSKCGTPIYIAKNKPLYIAKNEPLRNESKTYYIAVDKNLDLKSTVQLDYVKKTLISKELDIAGVKSLSEQGSFAAMLRQAFRYEMGIGVEIDIPKAEELYNKVGVKNSIIKLEQGHINCILPDPIYDEANPQNDFYVLPFVKDLMLDYYMKVEEAKKNRTLTKEKSEEYRRNFVRKMMDIRELHPELFLINLDEIKTDEETLAFFDTIKKNAAKRYSLEWLPSLFYFTDYIDDSRIEIPSIYNIGNCSIFTIKEKSEKIHDFLRRFVLTLLLQLPINKIRLNFVDLQKSFVYENLLGEIPPMIYGEKPITSREQFNELIDFLKERKINILQKYNGNYPQFCNRHCSIPLPYEFVFLFDSTDKLLDEETLNLFKESYRFGVYLVTFKKNETLSSFNKKGFIINSTKQEFYTNKSLPINSYFIESGFTLQDKGISNDQLARIKDSENNIEGYGLYDVIRKYLNNVKGYKLPVRIKTFQSATAAHEYIKQLNLHKVEGEFEFECDEIIKRKNICLVPYYVKNQKIDQLGIALAVSIGIRTDYYQNYKEDILFYLNKIGYNSQISRKIIGIIENKDFKRVEYDYFPHIGALNKIYSIKNWTSIKCLCIEKEEPFILEEKKFRGLVDPFGFGHKTPSYDHNSIAYIFPNFINRKYKMNFGWGYNNESKNDVLMAFNTIKKCEEDIKEIEQELHRVC